MPETGSGRPWRPFAVGLAARMFSLHSLPSAARAPIMAVTGHAVIGAREERLRTEMDRLLGFVRFWSFRIAWRGP